MHARLLAMQECRYKFDKGHQRGTRWLDRRQSLFQKVYACSYIEGIVGLNDVTAST